ncbi:MAG: glycoside hydrolase family 3 N-terminal domain-containing protein [Cytophagaceae bacterium]
MIRQLIVILTFALFAFSLTSFLFTDKVKYKNPEFPVDQRVDDLISRMTLEEKVAQLTCIWEDKTSFIDKNGDFLEDKASEVLKHGIGQIGRPSEKKNARQMAEFTNEIQKFFIEKTRLGIPVIFHEECLHGHAAPDGTSFPQPIGLASSWDRELVEELFTMTAKEVRLRGGHQALTPVVDVAREPRWGRVEETYGEDPYLVGQMGLAAVRGFQGRNGLIDNEHVIATLKHFAAHGQPESGTNCAPVNISERLLRETHLYPFKVCVEEGKVKSIMASYNEIDGIPSHANVWLIENILRGEWKFSGTVVSDYYAIKELISQHKIAENKNKAAELALKAGVDVEMPDGACYPQLVNMALGNKELMKLIDKAVGRVLTHKFELGLFDNPYVDPEKAHQFVGSKENRELALKAARKSVILLKNENNTAPLDRSKIKTIAVIGPNANRELLGGYSDKPKQVISVYDGIKQRAGAGINVVYSEGCKITEEGSWYEDPVIASNPEEDKQRIKAAVKVAKKSDVIVLCIGGNELTSREAWDENHMGDRTNLNMVGMQEELVKAMLATGKPVIVFLFNGRPLSINYLAENVPVIFECWYLGQEAGFAVADVLFGDYNPGGKLPITIPRSVGHTPAFYNYKPSARRGYLFDDISPLYPFGFGLSYSSFRIDNFTIERNKIQVGESVKVFVDIENTGKVEGDEVVQLYIRDVVSSVTRPVIELKDFVRVTLKPEEKKTLEFTITPDKLAFYDLNMNFLVEPGQFEVYIGNSSQTKLVKTFEVVE